ncbi:unnamed protein product, partial [Mesorhabditis spiculigera]
MSGLSNNQSGQSGQSAQVNDDKHKHHRRHKSRKKDPDSLGPSFSKESLVTKDYDGGVQRFASDPSYMSGISKKIMELEREKDQLILVNPQHKRRYKKINDEIEELNQKRFHIATPKKMRSVSSFDYPPALSNPATMPPVGEGDEITAREEPQSELAHLKLLVTQMDSHLKTLRVCKENIDTFGRNLRKRMDQMDTKEKKAREWMSHRVDERLTVIGAMQRDGEALALREAPMLAQIQLLQRERIDCEDLGLCTMSGFFADNLSTYMLAKWLWSGLLSLFYVLALLRDRFYEKIHPTPAHSLASTPVMTAQPHSDMDRTQRSTASNRSSASKR